MLGDRIIIGVTIGRFYEQAGTMWEEAEWGLDTGRASWLTHPSTPVSTYPKRGQKNNLYPKMFITDCPHVHEESGLVLITASYRGLLKSAGGDRFKERIVSDTATCIFTLPALVDDTHKSNIVAPIPQPRLVREYCTTVQPTNEGVSLNAAAPFLPAPPSFSVSFVPDPDQAQTLNYRTGWVLDSRQWEDPPPGVTVWLVRETFTYYFSLAV